MASDAADPMEQGIDSGTSTLERKRPHDVTFRDEAPNADSKPSTPRKRVKHPETLGYQDVREFVPVGASFSTSVVPLHEAQNSGDDGPQVGTSVKADILNRHGISKVSGFDVAIQGKALVEGRRLLIRNLPPDTTEEDLKHFFEGYSIESIWLPSPIGDDSQLATVAQKENLSSNRNSPIITSLEEVATNSTQNGPRLANVTIPVNSFTNRSVGHGFVTVSTSGEADRALSQLSGKELLEQKISVQQAGAEDTKTLEQINTPAQLGSSITKSKSTEGHRDNRSVRVDEQPEEENVHREIPQQDVKAAPPKSWNAVNSTKIRTSLGGSIGKVKDLVDKGVLADGANEPAERHSNRDHATAVALERVKGLRIRLSTISPHDVSLSVYQSAQQELHDAEVDYNYCMYFPVDEAFQPPPLPTVRRIAQKRKDRTEYRIRMWNMIEHCMKEGTLQNLKHGKVRLSCDEHSSQPSPKQRSAFESNLDALPANVKPIPKKDDKSHEREGTSETDREVILNLDHDTQVMPLGYDKKDHQIAMESEDRDEQTPSDADDQRIIHELPATDQIDNGLYANDSGAASSSVTESNDSNMDSDGQSEDEEGDAMMQYSNSEQPAADGAEQKKEAITVAASKEARILADLSSHDLNTQLRYFHPTKTRQEVDGKTLVRCLVCAREGHMAESCKILTCATCGVFNKHTTLACPDSAKCGKCREQGHDEGHCYYKLKEMPRHEIICDLCQRNGHIEEDCELIWRTSGRPWDLDLAHANVRLSCYECGHSGHLGNDCPSRKPDKPMGTSTWNDNTAPVLIKSTRELKIKGKATQRDRINLNDSDDERANFLRPKISVPEPIRKGQIRIVAGKRESPVYEATRNDRQVYADHRYGSVNGSYRNDDQQHRNVGRGNWRAGDGPDYTTDHKDIPYNRYEPLERRSRSPTNQGHGRYAGGSPWPSSRSAPQAEYQDRLYRPMPSAAQNAWIRHRL